MSVRRNVTQYSEEHDEVGVQRTAHLRTLCTRASLSSCALGTRDSPLLYPDKQISSIAVVRIGAWHVSPPAQHAVVGEG